MVIKTDNNIEEDNAIIIRGARQHNLKNIDLSLPRNKFIVFTGILTFLYLGINLLFLQESVEVVKVL